MEWEAGLWIRICVQDGFRIHVSHAGRIILSMQMQELFSIFFPLNPRAFQFPALLQASNYFRKLPSVDFLQDLTPSWFSTRLSLYVAQKYPIQPSYIKRRLNLRLRGRGGLDSPSSLVSMIHRISQINQVRLSQRWSRQIERPRISHSGYFFCLFVSWYDLESLPDHNIADD